MNNLRKESEGQYHDFCRNALVYESRDFGCYRRPHSKIAHRLEVRAIDGKYTSGCIQRSYLDSGEIRFIWFNLYSDELLTLEDCVEFCEAYISGFQDAENEHRQAGIDHYQSEAKHL